MKAMVYTGSGPADKVIQLMDITTPSPKDDEVLVEVKSASVGRLDSRRFASGPDDGFSTTRILETIQHSRGKPLGGEVAGVVVEVGAAVNGIAVGDEVYGRTVGVAPTGGWAEYAVLNREHLAKKPSNLTFEEAAAIPSPAETALGALRKARIVPHQKVMVYGASGAVGLMVVQLAKAAGAEVTGVCSTRNIGVVYDAGADSIIDYMEEDFRKGGKKYDAIIGVNGNHQLNEYKALLTTRGIFVAVGGGNQVPQAAFASPFSSHVSFYAAPLMPVKGQLPYVSTLAEQGKVKPFVDRVYPVTKAAEAIRFVNANHVQGRVVLGVEYRGRKVL